MPDPPVVEKELGFGYTPIQNDHDDKFGIPTLEDLGEFLIYISKIIVKNECTNIFSLKQNIFPHFYKKKCYSFIYSNNTN